MTTFARELRLLAPHRWWIGLGVLMGFLAIGSSVGLMATSAYLISRAAVVDNVAEVAIAITAVRVLAIGRAAFRYIERYVTHRATFRILTTLRVWFFAAIEPRAPAGLDTHRSGDLLSRIVGDIDSLQDLPVRVVAPPLVAALVVVFVTLLLGTLDASLGVVVLVFLLLTGVVLPLVTGWLTRRPDDSLVTARARLGAELLDQVQGVADLLAMDQAGVHNRAVLDLGLTVDKIDERLALVRGITAGMAALLASLCGIVLLGLAVPLVTDGHLEGVYLALVPLAAIASFEAVQPLSLSIQLLDDTQAAGSRLFELIDAPALVPEPVMPTASPSSHGISVRGLSFRYGPGDREVLDRLDLGIPDGTSLALIGPSGAGKTTLVDLLLRFRDYGTGEIAIGGTELRDQSGDDVRAMIAVVPQVIHLFNGTVRDNLAVADGEATDDAIEQACRVAQIHDVIAALPDGYATRIGEDGMLLSGGERQRIAIARAVLKDAPILILDEATANLDEETEARLLDALAEFMHGRTTLVITHRSAVAARTDRALALALPGHGDLSGAAA